jgi:hypothetical protein
VDLIREITIDPNDIQAQKFKSSTKKTKTKEPTNEEITHQYFHCVLNYGPPPRIRHCGRWKKMFVLHSNC